MNTTAHSTAMAWTDADARAWPRQETSASVLLVGKTPSLLWQGLRTLNAAGIRPYVLSPSRLRLPAALGLVRASHAWDPRRVKSSPDDDLSAYGEGFARQVAELTRLYGIEVVIPVDMPTSLGLAEHVNVLMGSGARLFPTMGTRALRALHDKWRFAQMCGKLSLPHAKTALIRRVDDVDQLKLSYPLVVKPLNRANGAGVMQFADSVELKRYLAGDHPFNALPLIAQEFVPGREIGVSVMAEHGVVKAWTMGYARRGRRRFTRDRAVEAIVERFVQETGFHGIGHFDMIEEDETGYLHFIEFNPRVWGSMLYSTRVGVNFLELGLRMGQRERRLPIVREQRRGWVGLPLAERLFGWLNARMS
ncbi:MAG: ATP-grasp domain-containing protein [Gammaproteobacteria bacterium]